MKAEQPRKPIGDEYNRLEFLRETEALHRRLNELIITPAATAPAATKADYAAGDVGSAANIAAALNVIAAALNANTAATIALLAKLNAT